ncbi:multicomponent Na+:H+ antiporter subunit G [Trueperella bonasi]|uniref:Multicomponent Na+:H+ antiporter subunit G n=1 Tax=Trueperella bonasi TaxID=312286 RepID=A0ABT9NGK5_9ACTO|nr:monovalent cation/H(+) antiporter subunit G [Trueperella bonasi]MDP9806512.1 multicomponent Na+:H+ antiporter subunit G [Trueperella bonasi]
MNWEIIADVVGIVLIVAGSIFTLIAAIGAFRYNDLLARQHVATKPQVFSLIMLMVGVSLMVREASMTWTMMLVIGFQLVSSPISAHMMARAGYRTDRIDRSQLVLDELGEDIARGEEGD